jgi:hypothetical protein
MRLPLPLRVLPLQMLPLRMLPLRMLLLRLLAFLSGVVMRPVMRLVMRPVFLSLLSVLLMLPPATSATFVQPFARAYLPCEVCFGAFPSTRSKQE